MSTFTLSRKTRLGWAVGSLVGLYLVFASTAYALFFAQANLGGMFFQTLSLDLQVSASADLTEPSDFGTSATLKGASGLVPGGNILSEPFWIKNMSSFRSLRIISEFVGNDSGVLPDLLEMRVTTANDPNPQWTTLRSWSESGVVLGSSNLESGQAQRYEFQYRLKDHYPMGHALEGTMVGDELSGERTGPWVFQVNGLSE